MNIKHRIENKIVVFDFEGTLSMEHTEAARTYIFDLLAPNDLDGVIFNWERVDYVDSQGVTLVLSVYKFLQSQQKEIALCHLNDSNHEIMTGLALDKYIKICSTMQEALEKLRKVNN
ncbi:MAG: STAS domain-containing protein [SAR324 cluster bacterium]|nr:STAS domain-containing protein [SAR324 cluster bacterium]